MPESSNATIVNGRINLTRPMPADLMATSSKVSPRLPNVMIDESSTARNAVFYGDKAIDRSPCGTGTSARMAQWFAKGWLKPGDEFIHESFIGSKFIGRIEEVTEIATEEVTEIATEEATVEVTEIVENRNKEFLKKRNEGEGVAGSIDDLS